MEDVKKDEQIENNETPFVDEFIIEVPGKGPYTFIYDFDKMSVKHIFNTELKFSMLNKLFTFMPQTPDDFKKAVLQDAKVNAMASLLLIKKEKDVGEVKYIYDLATNIEALENMHSSYRERMESAKENFLNLTGMQDGELMMRLSDTIRLQELATEHQSKMLEAAREGAKEGASEFYSKMGIESIMKEVSNLKNSVDRARTTSSGSTRTTTKSKGKKR